MTSREMQMLVEAQEGATFFVQVEPEGMQYDLPPHAKVLLTCKAPDVGIQYMSVVSTPVAALYCQSCESNVRTTAGRPRAIR